MKEGLVRGCSWHTEYGITFCNANTYEGECDSYNDDCWVYTDNSERLCCAKSEDDCCNSSSAAVGVAIGILVSIAISLIGCICACCFCCPGCPMHQRRMQAKAQTVHSGAISLPQFGASLTYAQPMTAAPMAHPIGTAPLSQQAVYAGVQPATTQPPGQSIAGRAASPTPQGAKLPRQIAGRAASHTSQGAKLPRQIAGRAASHTSQGAKLPRQIAGRAASLTSQGAKLPRQIAGCAASPMPQGLAILAYITSLVALRC
ncbi:hypothetical protein CYMTET_6490 [Cymbomonas tetramitiformis]|uniref:Uncharacterized protein n=1 Tax=Cymbomonas tetramitiformis TaxID=36881 RepID=A0AAE0LIC7_9CHLO|nr:hypothetical protein CYMTET_6490 [Cymbomonas tetramitiformis]